MRYCDAVRLNGLLTGRDRGISPYLTVSGLLIERTLRYHNEHQGLRCTGWVHQMIPESVEWLVIAVTGEPPQQRSDCYPIEVAGRQMRRLA